MTDTPTTTPAKKSAFSGLMGIFVKGGLGLAAVAIIGGAAYLTFMHFENQSKAQLVAVQKYAHDAGLAEAQRTTAESTNVALAAEFKRLEQWQADTTDKLNQLRTVAQTEHKTINDFKADDVAVQHPEEVEAWANKTTGDLFSGIAVATTGGAK